MPIVSMSRPSFRVAAAGVLLSWTAPTLDESGASITPDGYIVYASQNSQEPQDAGITADTGSAATTYRWTDPALSSGTWYGWVRAYENYSGNPAYSTMKSLGQIAP